MKYKYPIMMRKVIFILTFQFSAITLSAQSTVPATKWDRGNIVSQALQNDLLYSQTDFGINDLSTFHVLDHGVDFDLPDGFKVNNKPVVLIQKGNIASLSNTPYFLFHTLNIEGDTAYVRVYLSHVKNNERVSTPIEIPFIKNNGEWETVSNQ